jgi:methionyl-tRNA synthetase
MIGFIEAEGLDDLNISRTGEEWGIRRPFDEAFTIYVWFDALLTYITGIGYGDDEATFAKNWPCDTHFIGKDITRFHTHIWPAMLWAAGLEAPKKVFSHGFVTVDGTKMGKSMGNVVQPLDIIAKTSVDAYRYFFMRECPFPGDGDYSGQRFEEVYNSELANNLGNLYSRCLTVAAKSLDCVLVGSKDWNPNEEILQVDVDIDPSTISTIEDSVKSCKYNLALQLIIQEFCTPANKFLEQWAPWKMVKAGDLASASRVIYRAVQVLRVAAILLKPFIPRSAEKIYKSFNFPVPWEQVKYADAATLSAQPDDLRVNPAVIVDGKPVPLFPRIG